MDLGLRRKVVLVTGGGVGIGAAISFACAAEGAIPIIINHDGPAIQQTLAKLTAQGSPFGFIPLWLRTAQDCRHAVHQAEAEFGKIDALVNNIGTNDNVGLETGSPDAFVESLNTNLLHVYHMAHYCLPLLKQRGGAIVNMASKVAYTGPRWHIGLCCGQGRSAGADAGVGRGTTAIQHTRSTRSCPRKSRRRHTTPGSTPSLIARKKLASIVSNIPLGARMTTPEEDRERGRVAACRTILSHYRSAHFCRWRLRASRQGTTANKLSQFMRGYYESF